jgi:hypothetical protein
MDSHGFARAWVVACGLARARVVARLPVKHHQPSLAPAPAPTPVRQHHRPGLARSCPALLLATPLRYRRTLSGFP